MLKGKRLSSREHVILHYGVTCHTRSNSVNLPPNTSEHTPP